MKFATLSAAVLLLSCQPIRAQAASSAQEERDAPEIAFLHEVAAKLNAFATYALKVGYPRRAREVYQEVLAEYDTDDAVAREALGFVKQGTAWVEVPSLAFGDRDNPDPAIGRLLAKRWETTAAFAGKGHRVQAQRLQEAGRQQRADWHYQRMLRFAPGEAVAAQNSDLHNFEGFVGTARDVTLLERSRLMDRAVAREREKDYPVSEIPQGEGHPLLDAGGIPYRGVASEHYRFWGNWDLEVLTEAAKWAERARAFCGDAFAGHEGFPPRAKMVNEFAFFQTREDWRELARKNARLLPPNSLDFVLEHTSACKLDTADRPIWIAGFEQAVIVHDLAVRWPVEQYAGLHADALTEGLGHAIVGRFFGRNLVFTVGPEEEKQRTVTSGGPKRKPILPDLSAWDDAAVESAWQGNSTPVVELPLLTAARFPADGRIKAWSFCDYMLRRSPTELRALDRAKDGKNKQGVAQQYREATGGDVAELEDSWRRFWTEETPLLLAVRNATTPLEAASKAGPQWLAAFNEVRAAALASVDPALRAQDVAVGWSAEYSTDCKLHAEYLAANRDARGAADEHTQRAGAKHATNEGRAFAQSALVATEGSDARKAMAQWMTWPGYRDALLNRGLEVVGLYADGKIAVFDVTRGQVAAETRSISYHPNGNNRQLSPDVDHSVPSEVRVQDLGPEVQQLLRAKGHAKVQVLGYPLTVHFYSHGGMPKASSIQCEVSRGGAPVPGVLHVASGGTVRRSSAPGLVAFYPLKPLERGAEHRVRWQWDGMGVPDEFVFTTR